MTSPTYDVAIVGGGHNGLTAAAYLARSGLSVLVLERLDRVGGAAVSVEPFPGMPARLSRYSYLVSVLPDRIVDDLGLDLELASRPTASYSPTRRHGEPTGLLVERPEGPGTADSFRMLTGGDDEYAAWCSFHDEVAEFARVIAPTMTDPLPSETTLRSRVDDTIWNDLVTRPIGEAIERRFDHDLVRGAVATDALIGTFASLRDRSLVQNRCFFYHVIGNGTGEWRVPVGGMGAVSGALARAAATAGADIRTKADVTAIRADADGAEVTWSDESGEHTTGARVVLANVAPSVLDRLLGRDVDPAKTPVGSQLKINLLLDRLPRLTSGIDPEVAFAGTFHLNESYSEIERAHAEAADGVMPTHLPGEVYCHSLTDPTILGDLPSGTHTLTYFGLHTPANLFDRPGAKGIAVQRALAALDEHLVEPLESVIARDTDGKPCIEAKTPPEIEADLAMPGGHIFHGDLQWPWLDDEPGDDPAQRWGVATGTPSVMLCGSGARRGGAVSGLGGHNAAQAVLESL